MSLQINSTEAIIQINENNDKIQNLGDDAAIVPQDVNGIDLLRYRNAPKYSFFEFFKLLLPEDYRNEMSEYVNAPGEHERDVVLNKYDQEKHVVNQPTQHYDSVHQYDNDVLVVEEKRAATHQKQVNYELMYKDKVCAFFIGSISIISLYAVFKLIERD